MNEKMVELVRYIASQFAQDQENLKVTLEEKEEGNVTVITANADDMGRIIGKQGRIAMAIRTIVKSASAKEDKKYFVEIRDM